NRLAEVADQKVLDVEAMYKSAQKEAVSYTSDSLEYQLLESDMQRLDRGCELLDNRIKELALTAEDANIGRMKAQILDVARVEDKPAKPKKALILAMALALGMMFGCGSALAADWMDQRMRSVEEVRITLGYPVLGVVPHIKTRRGALTAGRTVALEPMSETAESYRTIRTAVYFGTPDGASKRLLITSPSPGDGKSTMASNLAIAMAKAGQRVVLLDCDFRRPTQHKVFELETEVGLSSVVAGQATLEQALRSSPAVEGLDILPCGPLPPNPAELLNSQNFADLLDQLANTYDHVLIDAPPVLAVTDARIIAAICDQTILVLRAEKSTRNMSLAARDGILSVGGQLLGVVVNDVPKAKKRNGYQYSYGYYRYGYYGQGQIAAGANGGGRQATALLEPGLRGTRRQVVAGRAANGGQDDGGFVHEGDGHLPEIGN
ncbi:MAG TPA: polysaccharide biosynthesis tyrosine autokinase, partial [Tepidisphaeraceae bacterium]